MDSVKELATLLREAGVRPLFGLHQQGHMPTVEKMLEEHATWDEIGKAIGWQGHAVKEMYHLETAVEAGAAAESKRARKVAEEMIAEGRDWHGRTIRELLSRLEAHKAGEPSGQRPIQIHAVDRLRAAVRNAPTYMEMEDLARALDGFKLDPWMVRTVSRMRSALNDIAYWHRKDEEDRPDRGADAQQGKEG